MAWTATIKDKGLQGKAFLVNVSYTNGSSQFNEVIDMTGGSLDALSTRIAASLSLLETTQALMPQISTGPYTPTTKPQTALETFMAAVRHFDSCNRAVQLGLITKADALYTAAQSNLTATWDPSFIDSL